MEFEATKFNWIGSVANEVSVCAFMSSSNIRTWQDMQTKKYVIGSSGAGADSHVFPMVLRNLFEYADRGATIGCAASLWFLSAENHQKDKRNGIPRSHPPCAEPA